MRKSIVLALPLALCGLAFAAQAQTPAKLAAQAKISMTQARGIALLAVPGKIVKQELEMESGGSGLRYSFDIKDHHMHREWLNVGAHLVEQVRRTRATGGRVIAVGTTVVRALESATVEGELHPFAGETQIFIFPGYRITSIDGLITNFHLPQSTLLMLVSALAGREFMLDAYRHAVEQRYRFFSYGDAMLILPRGT